MHTMNFSVSVWIWKLKAMGLLLLLLTYNRANERKWMKTTHWDTNVFSIELGNGAKLRDI